MYKFPSLDNTLTHLKKSKTKTFFNVFIYLFLIYPSVSAMIHKKKRRAIWRVCVSDSVIAES